MNAYRALCVGAFFYLATAAAFAGQPFNSCTFSVDEEGFIVVDDLVGEGRFFPLATFFYPCIGPIMDNGGGGNIDGHYSAFNSWGGNCVICPWDISHWPQFPGALFDTSGTCDDHLRAAEMAYCKLIADPSLFWSRGPAFWPVGGATVTNEDRQTWFNEFKGWCEDSYANALLGYWQWHEPAWRFWTQETPPDPIPTPAYLVSAYNQVRILDQYHGVFMGEYGAVITHELWRDYFLASDCSATIIEPCPAPYTLDNITNSEYYLPNHNYSVVGDLADVASEAARSHSLGPPPPSHRNQPYIAVLQGDLDDEDDCPPFWYKFMAYDAIIHGAKGIAWYDEDGGDEAADWYWPAELSFLSTLQELDRLESEYALLTADYDSPLVRVISSAFGNEVERSAFVGGKLVPKTHFLSSERIMEGCAKIDDGWTYLIVACRAATGQQPVEYDVEFYPYYSAYDYDSYWPGPVYEWNGYAFVDVGTAFENGKWTASFVPGHVRIFRFEKPAPWQPPGGEPE